MTLTITRCARVDCGNVAVANPEVRVWAPGTPLGERTERTCIPLRMHLPHCERHCGIVTPPDIIGDAGWQVIVAAVEKTGRVAPDRSSAVIVWRRLSLGLGLRS